MFKHDIWNQIKHIACFAFFFSESSYGPYMNIYMNWSRKVSWKWGPVMETGNEHIQCQALLWRFSSKNKTPLISFSPQKYKPPALPFVSSKLSVFKSEISFAHQHGNSNTVRLELYHNSTAEETALHVTVNSPHLRSCFKRTGKSSETHLSQSMYGSLRVFFPRGWHVANHHPLKRRMKRDSTGLHYSKSTQRWPREEQGCLSPAKPSLQWLCYKQTRQVTEEALSLRTSPFQNLTGGGSGTLTDLPGTRW